MKLHSSSKPTTLSVVWSPLSLIRFEEIHSYLEENFGHNSADEFSLKLLSAASIISQNPEIGKKWINRFARLLS